MRRAHRPTNLVTFAALAMIGAFSACSPAPSQTTDTSSDVGPDVDPDVAATTDTTPADVAATDVALNDTAVEGPLDAKPGSHDGQSTTVISRRDATVDTPDSASDTAEDDTHVIAPECADNGDCVVCPYPAAPATTDDCYCVNCPTTYMTATKCAANQEAWQSLCNAEVWPDGTSCPQPRCIPGVPAICASGMCGSACEEAVCPAVACDERDQMVPFGECCPICSGITACYNDNDCTRCADLTLVTATSECECRSCRNDITTRGSCALRQEAFTTFCEPWPSDQEACPIEPCLLDNAAIRCDRFAQCAPHPQACQVQQDCTACPIAAIPTHFGECQCPQCPTPTSKTFCDEARAAHSAVCADFDESACPQVDCLQGDLTCPLGGGACEFRYFETR